MPFFLILKKPWPSQEKKRKALRGALRAKRYCMNKMKILDTGEATAVQNMAMDAQLLQELSDPILHLYDWKSPSATYGHFIKPESYIQMNCELELARRPTGGGIIFHVSDFAFSVLIPASHPGYSLNTLENYAFINERVRNVIQSFLGDKGASLLDEEQKPLDESSQHFCMAKPTKYDVMIGGCKAGGGAQRRTQYGFLHQGTISIALPSEEFLSRVLKPGTQVLNSMRANTFALLAAPTQSEIKDARQTLRDLIIEAFRV